MFSKESYYEIKERANIIELVSSFISLEKHRNYAVGFCPFHEGEKPTFECGEGHFHCTECGANGDVISFLMTHKLMQFTEAIEFLVKKYNIKVYEKDEESSSLKEKKMFNFRGAFISLIEKYQLTIGEVLDDHVKYIASMIVREDDPFDIFDLVAENLVWYIKSMNNKAWKKIEERIKLNKEQENMKKTKDIKKVVKREKLFSTLAKKEGQSAAKRAKVEKSKGLKDSAKDSRWESKVAMKFAKIRKEKAQAEEKKLKKK